MAKKYFQSKSTILFVILSCIVCILREKGGFHLPLRQQEERDEEDKNHCDHGGHTD